MKSMVKTIQYAQATVYQIAMEKSVVIIDYDILVSEEFSCLKFHMDRDTISWILNNWIQEVPCTHTPCIQRDDFFFHTGNITYNTSVLE